MKKDELEFTVLDDMLPMPTRATRGSAGYDLYISSLEEKLTTSSLGTYVSHVRVGLGTTVKIPEGHVGLLTLRSSTAVQLGEGLVNGVGIIDSDFTGELTLLMQGTSLPQREMLKEMKRNKARVAQLVVVPFVVAKGDKAKKLRTGGTGSTGI